MFGGRKHTAAEREEQPPCVQPPPRRWLQPCQPPQWQPQGAPQLISRGDVVQPLEGQRLFDESESCYTPPKKLRRLQHPTEPQPGTSESQRLGEAEEGIDGATSRCKRASLLECVPSTLCRAPGKPA